VNGSQRSLRAPTPARKNIVRAKNPMVGRQIASEPRMNSLVFFNRNPAIVIERITASPTYPASLNYASSS